MISIPKRSPPWAGVVAIHAGAGTWRRHALYERRSRALGDDQHAGACKQTIECFPSLYRSTRPTRSSDPRPGLRDLLTYTATDNLTLFGNLKRAYKSGSYDITSARTNEDKSFGDEKVEGGELGLKSRWLDDSLAVNVSGYYYTYDDLQVDREYSTL